MPKVLSIFEREREFGKEGFYIFDKVKKIMMCKLCNTRVDWFRKDTCLKHINSALHKRKKSNVFESSKQATLENSLIKSKNSKEDRKEFIMDTTKTFMEANIPIEKLDHPSMRCWMDKYVKGCKVIGFAGSDNKVKWLVEELGFDAAYNYKTKDIAEALEEAAPEGVDCYFDNVGGRLSSAVIQKMRSFGRISVCGSISSYNSSSLPEAPIIQPAVLVNQLTMQGFVVGRWKDQWQDGLKQLVQWTKEGKLKYQETVTEGFENTPKAFISMLRGENLGKAVVKV